MTITVVLAVLDQQHGLLCTRVVTIEHITCVDCSIKNARKSYLNQLNKENPCLFILEDVKLIAAFKGKVTCLPERTTNCCS